MAVSQAKDTSGSNTGAGGFLYPVSCAKKGSRVCSSSSRMIISVGQNAGFEHLSALAKVSRLLRDIDLREKLRANPNSKTLYALLTEAQRMQAA